MSTITFDTLKYAERLEKAGLTREQAAAMAEAQKEVFAEALESELVTKSDIQSLRSGLDALELRLSERLADQKADTLKWVAGMLLGQAALVAALVKLL